MLWSQPLANAATEHLIDLQKNQSIMSHIGSDKSTYADRVERQCRWGGALFEAMDFAPRTEARDVIVGWLLDDGDKQRTHRAHLFNPMYKLCAVAVGPHPRAGTCTVALFAAQVVHKAPPGKPKRSSSQGAKNVLDADFCRKVFTLHNKVRMNPASFIAVLEKGLARFKGNVLYRAD